MYGGGGGGAKFGGGGPMMSADQHNAFNRNAPVFNPPGGGLGATRGDARASHERIGSGASMPPPPMTAGAHSLPPQQQQFAAGAALAGLRKTGQSSRHDAFFMPSTLRHELWERRLAAYGSGDPSSPQQQEVAAPPP